MILLVHMIFGAAVGYAIYSFTNNIWLAAIFSLVSHYVSDIFPHIEYLESTEESIHKIKRRDIKNMFGDFLKVLLDFCLGSMLVLILSGASIFLYALALLAIIPDGLTVLHSLIDSSILKKHHEFHGEIIHYLTKKKKFSLFWRISTQVIIVAMSIFILAI